MGEKNKRKCYLELMKFAKFTLQEVLHVSSQVSCYTGWTAAIHERFLVMEPTV